jgi:hypothetical protein
MTDSLLKWSGALGKLTVGAGLGAAGLATAGFWGMDRVGHGVMDKRMRAQGLGTSIGGLQSFNVAYGRLGNTEAMLGAANTAKSSISSHERQALVNLGIAPADIDRLPSDELAALMVSKVKGKSNSIKDDRLYFTQMDALGVPLAHDDLNRIRGTSDAELGGLEKRRRADKPGMEISDADAKKWTDFVNKVAEVAKTIENKFTVKLSALAEPLSHLSDGVGKLADTFIEKDLGPWIDGLAAGLEDLNKVVAGEGFKGVTKAFLDDMKLAAEGTAKFVHGLAAAARWLGVSSAEAAVNPTGATGADSGDGGGSSPYGALYGPGGKRTAGSLSGKSPHRRLFGHPHVSVSHGGGGAAGGDDGSIDVGGDVGGGNNPTMGEMVAYARKRALAEGADPDIITGIMMQEGGLKHPGDRFARGRWGHPDPSRSGRLGTAYGPFQLRVAAGSGGGVGNQFLRAHPELHGIDSSSWKQQIDFAVHRAARTTSDWMAVGDSGGIGRIKQIGHGFNSRYSRQIQNSFSHKVDTEYGPQLPDHVVTHKKKVSIRSVPGSDVFAQSMSTRWGLV